MAVSGAVGHRARHADRTDRVELVGIKQAGSFDGVGPRPFAKAMGLDGVTHRLDALGRIAVQQLTRSLGSAQLMVRFGAGRVVQQRGCAHDLQICAFLSRDVFGQGQHPKNVIEGMGGICVVV